MKPRIFLVFLLTFFCFFLNAQTRTGEKYKTQFGFGIGANFTKAPLGSYIPSVSSWSKYTESHYGVGFNIKVFISMPISSHFYLQPELGFSLCKQKQIYGDDYPLNVLGSVSNTDKLVESAISIGGILKYRTKFFSVSVGPQMGLITAANINSLSRSNGYNNTLYLNSETDFKKDGKTYDPLFSLLFGVCNDNIYRNLGVGFYYNLGLSNYTSYYQIQQIGKVSGFSIQISYILKK